VRGAALAALAARTLEDGAGIPATSITRLLAAIRRDGLERPAPSNRTIRYFACRCGAHTRSEPV
jgi:hypothetical protein